MRPQHKHLNRSQGIAMSTSADTYKDREGEWQEKPEWFKPVAFGKQATLKTPKRAAGSR
jgi:single-stranded DNA-binding protein